MAAGKYDFTIEQGTTYEDDFTWRVDDGSDPPTGPIINLTGCTARMQIRPTISDATIIQELTTENGGIIITGGNVAPNIQWIITDLQTEAMSFTTAVYDLEVVLSTGKVRRLLKGTVSLDKEVTR